MSELIKRKPNVKLTDRSGLEPAHTLFTSCICILELRFGNALRKDFDRLLQRISREIISRTQILPIGEKEVLVARDILADLRKTCQIIGLEDMLIAASAITNQYTAVAANIRHFSSIRGLQIENWLAPE